MVIQEGGHDNGEEMCGGEQSLDTEYGASDATSLV